tara:strand:+ start:1950 stop:4586 length:2637 start_codon:yes stop_codon:yes gene_type:complete
MASKLPAIYYLQGSGKKSRRKTKESRTENTLATQSEGVDHFILIKIISLLRKEKNAPDDKLEFLLQDLAENGIRVDNAHFHLRFNNGEPLNKKELIKMLQKARVRFIEPVIHHILNALDDIVVKVKDIDSKTEIEYLELLYSPQNMAVYFNIEKSFNELKLESHKLNLGILLHRTLLEYLRLFNEELDKLLKFDIEQIVSADTQRAHKDSERLYRASDKKSWHGFPVQQQASFEAAIGNEILQDTDSKGELLLSSTLEHYLKRKGIMWRDSIFTAAKNAKNRLNIKKLMKPFQDMDEDFPPFVPEDIEQSISNLYDKTKEMNDFNQLRVQEATIRDDYKKALEVKKESDIQLDKIKEVKDKLAGELITVITHNGEDLDTLRINNAKKRLEEDLKKQAKHTQIMERGALVAKGQERRKEMQAKLAQMMEASLEFLGNKLPPSLRNENAGKNYRNILNATLRKPDGKYFELDITTQIDSENKQLKSYAVTWAKDEETLQKLVNLLEDFNYITNNKPIHNKFGQQTLETLYRVYDVIDSPEKYSKRQINNAAENVTNIRNALWPNDIELWQTYDNIKKIYNSLRNYLLRNGWNLKPSFLGDTIVATPAPIYAIYGSKTEDDPFSNTEYKLLIELVDRFSILLPENEILINERRLEMQKGMQMQNTNLSENELDRIVKETTENELDKMVKETNYITSILKGILELPSDKNKWTPSKLQKWKILDLHKRLSIDLEKLLEEEKKRVVENIKPQLREGQEWKGVVEISAEDMDSALNIDQFKKKDDEKIKSIISPIIDELLKETSTNSDYLNEIIDEATTEEIQQADYYDSEDDSEVEPLWKLRKFIWDSDDDSEDDSEDSDETNDSVPPLLNISDLEEGPIQDL